jgi:hypothetical protein
MSNLAERLDHFPEAWRPTQAGEKLIGELVDVDFRDSEYGDPYPILVVLDADGREWAWHGFHAAARREVARKRPQIGERIGVVFAGIGEASPGMSAPVRWRLLVDRPKPASVDYSQLGDSADTGPAPADEAPRSAHGDDDIPF